MYNQQLNIYAFSERRNMKIDFDKTYHSNGYGDFKIIEDIGYDKNNKYWIKIKFIVTRYEKVVRYDIAMSGKVRDELYGIDFTKIYISNSGFPYKIVQYMGRHKDSKKLVLIEFLQSGTKKIVQLRQAINGSVYDEFSYINFNKIYWSNQYGPFKIIQVLGNINNHMRLLIRFINTGYEKDVQLENVKNGQVKDDIAKFKDFVTIDRIGKEEYDRRITIHLRNIWKEMINRCTNQNCSAYKSYGAKGIRVSNEWLNFDQFLNDVQYNFQYDKFYYKPYLYQLDKDYKQLNIPKYNRIYSKDTCVFLYYIDNNNLSTIEFNRNNNLTSSYYGVMVNKNNNYEANIMINQCPIFLGIYDSEIAAANAYNSAVNHYHNYELIPLLNEVPIMSTEEIRNHRLDSKIVCKVLN